MYTHTPEGWGGQKEVKGKIPEKSKGGDYHQGNVRARYSYARTSLRSSLRKHYEALAVRTIRKNINEKLETEYNGTDRKTFT